MTEKETREQEALAFFVRNCLAAYEEMCRSLDFKPTVHIVWSEVKTQTLAGMYTMYGSPNITITKNLVS